MEKIWFVKIYPAYKIYILQATPDIPKTGWILENRLNSSKEVLDGWKTQFIGAKPKIVAWTNKWRFLVNIGIQIEFSDPKIVRKHIPNEDLGNFIMGGLSLIHSIRETLRWFKVNSRKREWVHSKFAKKIVNS